MKIKDQFDWNENIKKTIKETKNAFFNYFYIKNAFFTFLIVKISYNYLKILRKIMNSKKNKFTEKQFIFYGLNFIVGFGFIITISSVISRGLWGILIFALTAFISMTVMLAFARL
ncbi:hypothetical protein ONA00_06345 [Mycoplasmopsis cynos]|uniref:hypothetical protein n=1 Tax=Mycoplasmopsis cynos TaxID=171284 RepID=UPI0024C9207D|nr:hypothetical protein [Mycoplasmopsis cynos]WAM10876.1 hypothetical protein ONA00_06345 [Mycoplasmopsis cynos]